MLYFFNKCRKKRSRDCRRHHPQDNLILVQFCPHFSFWRNQKRLIRFTLSYLGLNKIEVAKRKSWKRRYCRSEQCPSRPQDNLILVHWCAHFSFWGKPKKWLKMYLHFSVKVLSFSVHWSSREFEAQRDVSNISNASNVCWGKIKQQACLQVYKNKWDPSLGQTYLSSSSRAQIGFIR